MTDSGPVRAPRTWELPTTHFVEAMRSDWYRSLVTVQDVVMQSTVAFWAERGVRNAHLPITTGSVSSPMGLGSDSRPVEVEIFGLRTYLADSMQFGLEYMCRLSPSGAYYVMPSFRGEDVDATHLAQFFHSEAEVPGGLDDVVRVVEAYLRRLVDDLLDRCRSEISAVVGHVAHLEKVLDDPAPFTRMTFDEAVADLGGSPDHVFTDGEQGWRSLTRGGEQELMRRHGEFLWVTDWDELAVPFYQAATPGTSCVRNGDLMFGPGEVVGCGERHETGEQVRCALARHGVAADGYEWYVAMKDAAPLRTAGFGMGVERFLMWLFQADDIRDFQVFLRENGREILP